MPNNDYVKREDIFPAVTEIAKEIVFGNQDDDKVVDIINSIPAADVEQVVRCENCQFFENVEYWPDGTKKVCQLLKRQVLENSFCCWGMKKEAADV